MKDERGVVHLDGLITSGQIGIAAFALPVTSSFSNEVTNTLCNQALLMLLERTDNWLFILREDFKEQPISTYS